MIVFRVRPNPEPHDDIALDDAERTVPEPDASGVDGSSRMHGFKAEASVLRVLPETAIRFTSPPLNMIR